VFCASRSELTEGRDLKRTFSLLAPTRCHTTVGTCYCASKHRHVPRRQYQNRLSCVLLHVQALQKARPQLVLQLIIDVEASPFVACVHPFSFYAKVYLSWQPHRSSAGLCYATLCHSCPQRLRSDAFWLGFVESVLLVCLTLELAVSLLLCRRSKRQSQPSAPSCSLSGRLCSP
jgi:hypothetical protein